MIQEIIVALIGVAVLVWIIRAVVRKVQGKPGSKHACSGCSGCSLRDCVDRKQGKGCSDRFK